MVLGFILGMVLATVVFFIREHFVRKNVEHKVVLGSTYVPQVDPPQTGVWRDKEIRLLDHSEE
jgi:hypothetical protein